MSDRKIGVYSGGSLTIGDSLYAAASYYEPHMVSATDYYAFGMVSRQISNVNGKDDYRFGFNGKENDNEVKGFGNQQDYGMRIYDPRVGRFLSVDPLMHDAPEITPYSYADNNPIIFIDINGGEPEPGFKIQTKSGYIRIGGPISPSTTKQDINNLVQQRIDQIRPPTPKETRTGRVVRVSRGLRKVANAAAMATTVLSYATEAAPLFETLGRDNYYEYITGWAFLERGRYNVQNTYDLITDDPQALPDWYLQNVKERLTKGTGTANDWRYKEELIRRGLVGKDFEGKGVTTELEGKTLPIYRGGESFDLKVGEYKVTPAGKYPARGLSLTADPAKAAKFGGAHRILYIPEELEIIFTPSTNDPLHHDIIPKDRTMSEDRYQELLKQIKTEPNK